VSVSHRRDSAVRRRGKGRAAKIAARMGSMDADALKAACLELTGSVETFPFNLETSVFKVGGKIFALSALDADPLSVSLKCEPELAERLRAQHPAITAGYHLNKRHWNTVLLDGSVPDAMVRDMIEDSYDLVVSSLPRDQRRALGRA
jgi:predicted DNA-binding protein (MmcQ/YjbR family)